MIRSARAALLLSLLAACNRIETTAQTSTPQTNPLNSLFVLQDTKTARVSSWDRTGGNNDFIAIAPGETKSIADISGAGVIRRFYAEFARGLRPMNRGVFLWMRPQVKHQERPSHWWP